MATEKNTLKNWFKTGLKPTQSQFWAWLDSFWHKDEKIPLSNIDGIDTALENKAETLALDGKANVDATELGAENILKWKEALGVGEVPDNMATIDQDGEQGNAYTKEQVDDLLESSGKNLGNTDLKIPENTVRVLDTTNAKLQIKGLEDKTNDKSFNKRLVFNANNDVAYTTDPEIILNMPQNSSITVNHIFPTTTPATPQWAEEVKEIMREYRNYEFNSISNDDFHTVGGTKISNMKFGKENDWILKMIIKDVILVGLTQEEKIKPNAIGFNRTGSWQTYAGGFSVIKGSKIASGGDGIGIIIKKGNYIICIGYAENNTSVVIQNPNFDFGDYMISHNGNVECYYKILN